MANAKMIDTNELRKSTRNKNGHITGNKRKFDIFSFDDIKTRLKIIDNEVVIESDDSNKNDELSSTKIIKLNLKNNEDKDKDKDLRIKYLETKLETLEDEMSQLKIRVNELEEKDRILLQSQPNLYQPIIQSRIQENIQKKTVIARSDNDINDNDNNDNNDNDNDNRSDDYYWNSVIS